MKTTTSQMKSDLFRNLAIRWISWLFDFKLIRIEKERNYLVFECEHLTADNKCGNYSWRPSICRNYPLLDYFEKPTFIPGCGYSCEKN